MSTTLHQAARASNELSPSQFAVVASIAKKTAGLTIPEAKLAMVQSRLQKRLRALKISTFDAYLDYVSKPEAGGELNEMISVLTTNVSSFFREDHHFNTLQKDVAEELLEKCARGDKIRIWSAGCSSGQEPYTIAMLLSETLPNISKLDVKILATDIDQNILEIAKRGEYPSTSAEQIPEAFRKKYFIANTDKIQISDHVKGLVTFKKLNLIEDWPMKSVFDVVFCRNVLIYFNEQTQEELWPKFQRVLRPGGWLFLGHSERLTDFAGSEMCPFGITTYRRKSG